MRTDQLRKIEQTLNIIAVAASTYLILRVVVGPDRIIRARMNMHLTTARLSNNVAERLNNVALQQMTAYHKCRNVTV